MTTSGLAAHADELSGTYAILAAASWGGSPLHR